MLFLQCVICIYIYIYLWFVFFYSRSGWLLRRHLLNILCFCVARSPDWGRLLLWDHHLHAVQRKEAMTLAEMFEMLMKMRAKEHIMKRTLMWPGHFVCLALMCKTDRRMFFLSGFLTVCESTHPEKVSCDLINRAQLVSVHSNFNRVVTTKDQQKHQHTSIWSHPFKHLNFAFDILSKSYPRRWRIQAFPEIRHHFNVRNPRIPYHPWDRTVYIYITTWKPINPPKKSTGRSWIGKYTKTSHGMVWKCWFSSMKSGWWQLNLFLNFHPEPLRKWSKLTWYFSDGWFNHQIGINMNQPVFLNIVPRRPPLAMNRFTEGGNMSHGCQLECLAPIWWDEGMYFRMRNCAWRIT